MKNLLKSRVQNFWLFTKDKEVQALVIGYDYVTGNLIAQLGTKRALLAPEDITIYQKKNVLDEEIHRLLGSKITCNIIGKNEDDILISRKAVMQKRIQKYNKGDIVEATVVSASNKALFLEFDEGLSGIMYTNQLTSSKVKKPLDLYEIGDKIKCVITKKKEDEGYFELSRVALYKTVTLKVERGHTLLCKINKKLDDSTGYFVEVLSNPLYSGIFDLNQYNYKHNYRVGEILNLKVVDVTDNKHLRLRTLHTNKEVL